VAKTAATVLFKVVPVNEPPLFPVGKPKLAIAESSSPGDKPVYTNARAAICANALNVAGSSVNRACAVLVVFGSLRPAQALVQEIVPLKKRGGNEGEKRGRKERKNREGEKREKRGRKKMKCQLKSCKGEGERQDTQMMCPRRCRCSKPNEQVSVLFWSV
jgi:hypothetical protein